MIPQMASIHDVPPDAFNYVWDNSIEPALEIESGESVQLHVRDASDEQIHKGSGVEDVAKLDFSHVNPVSGPVYVKGAQPGDVLEVELLAFEAKDWGWTAIIPGFGLLADEFPDPWLRISEVDAAAGNVRFGEKVTVPHRPFPGTLGVAMPEPGGTRSCRRLASAGTWTSNTSVPASGSSCPWASREPCFRWETRMRPRATARCAAQRSRPPWTSSSGSPLGATSRSTRRSSTCRPARRWTTRGRASTSAQESGPT